MCVFPNLIQAQEMLTKLTQELRNSQQELDNDELQMDKERGTMTQTLKAIRTELQERM